LRSANSLRSVGFSAFWQAMELKDSDPITIQAMLAAMYRRIDGLRIFGFAHYSTLSNL
jgi:hypothetical protein